MHRTIATGHYVLMVNYRRSEEDERRILRCAACDGTVFAEIPGFVRADANTACASCGIDSPFSGGIIGENKERQRNGDAECGLPVSSVGALHSRPGAQRENVPAGGAAGHGRCTNST